METQDIHGVEICAPGVWNDVPITDADLSAIVEANRETAALVPPRVRLGHNLRQQFASAIVGAPVDPTEDGLPALGEPTNLRVVDGRLVADLARVPKKIVDLARANMYRGRSVGLRRNVTVNGKTYPWLLDHVALLGEQRPAVDGLRDMFLSAEEGAVVLLSGVDFAGNAISLNDIGGTETPPDLTPEALEERRVDSALEQINGQLGELQSRANELTRGRRGNPVINSLFRALREGITRIVSAQLAAGENPMTDVELMGNAAPEQGGAEAPMGGGLTISTPEVLAAMLAAKLGKGPEDFTAIYQAAVALIDAGREAKGEADPSTAPAPATAAPMEGANMSAQTVDFTAALAEQREELAKTKAELAALQVANHRTAAAARADRDIEQHCLPVAVRDALIDLTLSGKDELYQAVIDSAARVPTSEKGVSFAAKDAASVELTPAELETCRALRLDPERFKAQKFADMQRAAV